MSISRNAFQLSQRMSSYFVRNISVGATGCKTKAAFEYSRKLSLLNPSRVFSTTVPNVQKDAEEVEVTFIKANGSKVKAKGKVGDSLLDVVVNNNLDFEGFGACEGTLTCSTCHLIFTPEDYERLPEKPSDEECDMLDLAYELCDTSRLGCQINLSKDMNGLVVKVPTTINDARTVPDS